MAERPTNWSLEVWTHGEIHELMDSLMAEGDKLNERYDQTNDPRIEHALFGIIARVNVACTMHEQFLIRPVSLN